MAITSDDIKFLHSTISGSAGYTETSTGAASLGKFCSTTEHTGLKNDLFDNVSGAENEAEDVEYRCMFVLNDHATLDLQDAVAYISSQVTGGTDIQIAVDDAPASNKGSSSAQATQIADEGTTPVGVGSFSAPTTAITGISIGTLPAGNVRALWVKRTATDSVAKDDDGFTLTITGNTKA
jgi:hypothetical protein